MDITDTHCIVVGDFNSHSERWGYQQTDLRGEEVEEWEIDNNLFLLNAQEDPPTFYSRRWKSTSTLYLAFATGDLSHKIVRMVMNQLGDSDHKPIKLTINLAFERRQPTYLRVTFDDKLTWKQHINRATTKARRKLAIMRKLSGTTRGTSGNILRKVYQQSIRPHLKYGSAAWCPASNTTLQELDKVQNQALRIMLGAMKSTPIEIGRASCRERVFRAV